MRNRYRRSVLIRWSLILIVVRKSHGVVYLVTSPCDGKY